MTQVRGLPPFGNTCYLSEKQIPGSTVEVQQPERERIILEIHDGPAQTLASAFQYLQTIDQIARPHFNKHQDLDRLFTRVVELVEQAIRETREIINGAVPAVLDEHGLVSAVRHELAQFGEETGGKVELYASAWPDLPRHVEFAIYRLIREAVSNVRKHARSPRLEVVMSRKGERLLVRVRDWGIGFIPERSGSSSSNDSVGLFSMRRRAELLGGTFKINSALGKGTEIKVDIPFKTEPG